MRTCKKCGRMKPEESFRQIANRLGKIYRSRICVECKGLANKDWYHNRGGKQVVKDWYHNRGGKDRNKDWYYNRGGKELVASRRRLLNPASSDGVAGLRRYRAACEAAARRLTDRIAELDIAIAKLGSASDSPCESPASAG